MKSIEVSKALPAHWQDLCQDDGKAMLKGSAFNQETGMFEKLIDDTQFVDNKAAAGGCPPN